jgi:lysophospholipase L1-like esterase
MPEEVQLQLHWREMSRPVPLSDPYLGYVYPPNHVDRIERPHSDFAFTFTTDEHGFRDPSPWPERADIVVLGDSMAFGYGVDDDKTWTTRLAARLPKNRVINLGVPGFAPQQYLRSYERFGEALRPVLVLAERNGSQFLVLLMPTKEEVYLPLLGEPAGRALASFLTAFDAAEIHLDLTPHLQASARQGARLYFEVDGHPNAAGYRMIADKVLDHLRRHPDRYDLPHAQSAGAPTN